MEKEDHRQLLLLTPDMAADLAEQSAPEVNGAESALRASQAQGKIILAPFMPQVNLLGSVQHQDLGTANSDDTQQSVRAQFNQYLYGFNLLKHSKLAVIDQEKSDQLQVQQTRLDIRFRARVAVSQALFAKAQQELSEQQLKLRELELHDAKLRFETGRGSQLDLRRAQLNQRSAQSKLKESEYRILESEKELRRSVLDQRAVASGNLGLHLSLEFWLEQAYLKLKDEPGLQRLVSQQSVADHSSKGYKANRLPQFNFSASTGRSGKYISQGQDSWNVALNMQWQLLSGGANKANERMYREQADVLQEQHRALEQELVTEYSILKNKCQVYQERLGLQEEIVSLAQQGYEDARSLYKLGRAEWVRVETAHLDLYLTQTEKQALLFECELMQHRLKRLAGD